MVKNDFTISFRNLYKSQNLATSENVFVVLETLKSIPPHKFLKEFANPFDG